MSIKVIATDELRTMMNKEGLILQGCGGELTEWVDGINDMLTQAEILLEGSKFENCMSFEHEGHICLMFPFDDVKLNIGKFAMWRLQTYGNFGGTWLSDYVPNRLGGFVDEGEILKPDCPLIGANGNIFNLMSIASKTLKANDMTEQAEEMKERIFKSKCYEEALGIIGEYVNITSVDGESEVFEQGINMRL